MKKRTLILSIMILLLTMLLSGCIPGDGSYTYNKPAGFLSGIWHGWIAPISLIISIFKPGIRIYEGVNTGWWYDFGFYMAVISGFGGFSLSRKKKKER
ncbi:hypothetical protein SAMN05660462_01827 [Proteiniborus ethanoligenes]|uniref:Lipoprotein n=1 Tax=Proteiniborus ethanoligenes TaxID=415015 RepID=A0A1H3Q6P6_9FIRM|nr:hypothetical protein [Proteiniborus ethanoligenes]SDZ09057.1 hypothetical protein SAMN05660462_01827 [Proteiniborus ethanoligenes]